MECIAKEIHEKSECSHPSCADCTHEEQQKISFAAKEMFLSHVMLRQTGSQHSALRKDLANDFTKGQKTHPKTRQENLKLMDASNKLPATVNKGSHSYGGSFAQRGGGDTQRGNGNQRGNSKPKFDEEFWKNKTCHRCGKDGHPAWAY